MSEVKTLNPLLDLDPVIYASGFAADAEVKRDLKDNGLDPDFAEEIDYLHIALGNAKTQVNNMLDPFPDRGWYKGFVSGSGNFRNEVATIKPYKGNRDPNHKPKYYKEIKEYLLSNFDTELVEGQEADDAIGITQFKYPDRTTCIVSIDKDLNMIPGWHYNPKKNEIYDVSVYEAYRFFLWQMLVGDPTDNIPGINKIGPKTADKILAEYDSNEDLEAKVLELYRNQYGPEGDRAFEEIRELLWIRRKPAEDYKDV